MFRWNGNILTKRAKLSWALLYSTMTQPSPRVPSKKRLRPMKRQEKKTKPTASPNSSARSIPTTWEDNRLFERDIVEAPWHQGATGTFVRLNHLALSRCTE